MINASERKAIVLIVFEHDAAAEVPVQREYPRSFRSSMRASRTLSGCLISVTGTSGATAQAAIIMAAHPAANPVAQRMNLNRSGMVDILPCAVRSPDGVFVLEQEAHYRIAIRVSTRN